MEIPEILNKSLCKNCSHRLSRTISTEGLPIYDAEDGFGVAEYVVPEDATDFEQNSCTILCIDLDHVVLDCSKFKEDKTTNHVKQSLIQSTVILDVVGNKHDNT